MYNSPVVNVNNLKIGSVKVEFSSDGNTWYNLGTGNKAKFTEKREIAELKSDNGGLITTIVKDQSCEVTYNMLEFDLNTLQRIREGSDIFSVSAGAKVTGATQTVASGTWAMDKFIRIQNQNCSNTEIAITSVTASTGGALIAGTDYKKSQNTYGEWGIIVSSASKIATISQNVVIVYDYAPVGAHIITSGGRVSLVTNWIRLTNINAAGKAFQIVIYKAYTSDGITIDFPADEDGKAWELPVKFIGSQDPNRPVGDQLFKIINNQI